jgi:UDP-glucose 4-epimerase
LVFDHAAKVRARVVFSSSAAVYGDGPENFKAENLEPRPLSPYGVQKLIGEQYLACYARLHGLEGWSLRYFNVYGPRQAADSPYSGVISRFVDCAREGRPLTIFGDGRQTRDFIYVADVVEANLAAAKSSTAPGESLNIGTGIATTLHELASLVTRISAANNPIRNEAPRSGDIRFSCASVAKAAESVGFVARTKIEEGLGQTLSAMDPLRPGPNCARETDR